MKLQEKKSCLIWLILLFFVLSYVFQKIMQVKKWGKYNKYERLKIIEIFFLKVWKHAKQRIKKISK